MEPQISYSSTAELDNQVDNLDFRIISYKSYDQNGKIIYIGKKNPEQMKTEEWEKAKLDFIKEDLEAERRFLNSFK